jgi:hypothetical protein
MMPVTRTQFVRPCSICGDDTSDADRLNLSVALPEGGVLIYDVHPRCFVGVLRDGQATEIAKRYHV